MKREFSKQGLPRTLEILLATVGLLILSPLMLLCAAVIFFSAPTESIIFRQKRVGKKGELFTIFKFRTMKNLNSGALVTASGDARITKVGKFFRKYKFDELPQLFNILRGEMSFVGPRPEVPELVDLKNPNWREILSVRPGLTDPVTLELRDEESLLAQAEDKQQFYQTVVQPYKIKGYVHYVAAKNWKKDLIVLRQTVRAVLRPQTAKLPSIEKIKLSVQS